LKKISLPIVLIISCFLLTPLLNGANKTDNTDSADSGMEALFPQLDGWVQKGDPAVYTPGNLYEYINGAADVFLNCGFVKLAALSFENKEKASVTVDIYRHDGPINGFGIYSQEKPQKGPFIPIGTQGYYEKGILNFLKGSYYVKISGFDLGDNDEAVLTEVAKKIAEQIKDDPQFPKTVDSFPKEGKIEHSERYISQNFLGHSFLHSAFVADYQQDGRNIEVFVIQAEDEKDAGKILADYIDFVKGKGQEVENPGDDLYRFQDPYYRSSGLMHMKRKGKYITGLFCKSPETANLFIKKILGTLGK